MLDGLRQTVAMLRAKLEREYAQQAYGTFSQYGEDMIIDRLLGCKGLGTFVDIGANDPFKFNNTARFYKRGWSGINVEPNPHLLSRFRSARPRDVNLDIGVGRTRSSLPFFAIDPDTLSTFQRSAADEAVRLGFRLTSTVKVEVWSLREILDEYLAGRTVDFISIDVEGFEIDVLESNDWDRLRPTVLIIEVNRAAAELQHFLTYRGYADVFSNGTNAIYVDVKKPRSFA